MTLFDQYESVLRRCRIAKAQILFFALASYFIASACLSAFAHVEGGFASFMWLVTGGYTLTLGYLGVHSAISDIQALKAEMRDIKTKLSD